MVEDRRTLLLRAPKGKAGAIDRGRPDGVPQ
jgi:hypothetical protein